MESDQKAGDLHLPFFIFSRDRIRERRVKYYMEVTSGAVMPTVRVDAKNERRGEIRSILNFASS